MEYQYYCYQKSKNHKMKSLLPAFYKVYHFFLAILCPALCCPFNRHCRVLLFHESIVGLMRCESSLKYVDWSNVGRS